MANKDKRKRGDDTPPSPRSPHRPRLVSPSSSPSPPTPPRDPYPFCLICLDEEHLHPEYALDCNHYCHLPCLRQYLATNISFCPDLSCLVPITSLEGVPVEARYALVDPDYAEH